MVYPQRTKQRSRCHNAGVNCSLLLFVLVDCYSGPVKPSFWTVTEHRHHKVPQISLALILPSRSADNKEYGLVFNGSVLDADVIPTESP